jgi:hypothetical protein
MVSFVLVLAVTADVLFAGGSNSGSAQKKMRKEVYRVATFPDAVLETSTHQLDSNVSPAVRVGSLSVHKHRVGGEAKSEDVIDSW